MGSTLGFGGNGGGVLVNSGISCDPMDDGDVSNSVSCSKSTFIGETLVATGCCWLRVIESRGAGCGASVMLLALLTGLKLSRTLRNLDAAAF